MLETMKPVAVKATGFFCWLAEITLRDDEWQEMAQKKRRGLVMYQRRAVLMSARTRSISRLLKS